MTYILTKISAGLGTKISSSRVSLARLQSPLVLSLLSLLLFRSDNFCHRYLLLIPFVLHLLFRFFPFPRLLFLPLLLFLFFSFPLHFLPLLFLFFSFPLLPFLPLLLLCRSDCNDREETVSVWKRIAAKESMTKRTSLTQQQRRRRRRKPQQQRQ